MMYDIKDFTDVKSMQIYKNKKGSFSDDIYTFDIETTSLFLINGKWQVFDYTISDYTGIDHRSCVYHCQFSVNNKVYHFYEIKDFITILKKISNQLVRKIVYVHNLAFETGFLHRIMQEYTIKDLVALQTHQPIRFVIEELNIEFRCSFKLTGLSLESASKQYTNVNKMTGDLNYNVARSPISAKNMTDEELNYCEMDCVCVYEIIKYYKNIYKHVALIPLTQTGTVRKALKKIVPQYHFDMVRKLVPSLDEYKLLKSCFMGGITHGNRMYINKTLHNVESIDIASSYPFVMCTEKFPIERFHKIKPDHLINYPESEYLYIYDVTFNNITSLKQNILISFSKCTEFLNVGLDNGRVFKADQLRMVITNIDYNMIKKCYDIESETINEVWIAKKDYLPKYLIEFILDAYCDKTKLKHVPGKEDIYNNKKVVCNCIYGACVTDFIKSSIIFTDDWHTAECTDEFIEEKLNEQRSFKARNLFVYSWGCFVTAYARRNLFERIIECNQNDSPTLTEFDLDKDVIYYDTDSLKMLNFDNYKKYFEDYNNQCRRKIMNVCLHYAIDYKKFYPEDINNIIHPLGYYDFEDGSYSEFRTLGAKRYAYRDKSDNKLHITISGVNKEYGVNALKNNINNFNKKLKFNYEDAHKNTKFYYNNEKPYTFIDNEGNSYTDTWGCGVVIMPTTYDLTMNFNFEWLVESCNNKIMSVSDFSKIRDEIQNIKRGKKI